MPSLAEVELLLGRVKVVCQPRRMCPRGRHAMVGGGRCLSGHGAVTYPCDFSSYTR